MIELRSLTKRFGSITAVDEVTFSCRAGEVFGLLGPNGAGKTTLLRLLATALQPTAGTAVLNGHDITTAGREVRRDIGVLPSNADVYGRLTPRENLRYFGDLYDMTRDRIETRTTELLTRLGLAEAADRRCEAFSSGMRQKVALARAILHDPPIVLLDEPTDGLDVPTARVVYEIVAELRAAGKCVLFSTHRMEEAERLCTRIGVIARGRMAALGTLEELRTKSGTTSMEEVFMRLVGETQ